MAPVSLLTPTSVRTLLAEHGLHPSRALGQNFLVDPNTARRVARLAAVGAGDRVLEIGPGIGSLTLALAELDARVVALELDRHLVPVLEEVLAAAGVAGVRVETGDALRVDLGALLDEQGPWAMVSNLPYNVAVPVVMRVLDDVPVVDRMLVMVQKEVGERLAAGPGTGAYGAVSVRVAWHGRAEVVGLVPPTVFLPRPKVDSALVRITRHASPPVDLASPETMFMLVRAGFATRRKTLRRALAPVLGKDASAVLEHAGIDPGARAEQLGLAEWAALATVVAERV